MMLVEKKDSSDSRLISVLTGFSHQLLTHLSPPSNLTTHFPLKETINLCPFM